MKLDRNRLKFALIFSVGWFPVAFYSVFIKASSTFGVDLIITDFRVRSNRHSEITFLWDQAKINFNGVPSSPGTFWGR